MLWVILTDSFFIKSDHQLIASDMTVSVIQREHQKIVDYSKSS